MVGGERAVSAFRRTTKSCSLGAPTLALSWRADPLMTVAKEPGQREEHEASCLKPFRREGRALLSRWSQGFHPPLP
jgi:hypothetical protein